MGRVVDVLFERLRWLVVGLVAIPMVAATATLVLDRTGVVDARIRVDPARFVDDALPELFPASEAPAQAAASFITQLVSTEWFSEHLVGDTPAVLRERLEAHAVGATVVEVTYRTADARAGLATMRSLLGSLDDAVQALEAPRAASLAETSSSALGRFQLTEQRTIDAAGRYAALRGDSAEELGGDPTYLRLIAEVRAAAAHHRALSALVDHASVLGQALPRLRGGTFVVVDAPHLAPRARLIAAARTAVTALVATAAVGLLAVYVIALFDPRLRTLGELRRSASGAGGVRRAGAVSHHFLADLLGSRPDPAGIVAVVSPHRRDGRSTVAADLTRALASEDLGPVLLLDLDPETSTHARRFGLGAVPGVVSSVENPLRVDRRAREIGHGAWLLAARPEDLDARPGLLCDVSESGLLPACRARFTWTVVDLPPLLGDRGPVRLFPQIDEWVMVGRHRHTRLDALRRAAALAPGPPLGWVMNGHRPATPGWVRGLVHPR